MLFKFENACMCTFWSCLTILIAGHTFQVQVHPGQRSPDTFLFKSITLLNLKELHIMSDIPFFETTKKNKGLASKGTHFSASPNFYKLIKIHTLYQCIALGFHNWFEIWKWYFFRTLDIHRIFKSFTYRSKTRFFTSTIKM